MEKKEEGKKMDSKTSWTQVVKSDQATSTSGSSFAVAGAVGEGAWGSSGTAGREAWGSSRAAGGGAWGSSGAAGGGAWGSSESNQQASHPVPPVRSSRIPYKIPTQRTPHLIPRDPIPNYYKEPLPVPEVRQVTAFPSLWSPSTARKVTKKN